MYVLKLQNSITLRHKLIYLNIAGLVRSYARQIKALLFSVLFEYRPLKIMDKYKRSRFYKFRTPYNGTPKKDLVNFLSFGDSWDGIGTVVSGNWGSITVSTMVSVSVKSVSTISGNWGSSIGGGSYWGSGSYWGMSVGSGNYWGMSVGGGGYWSGSDGNWGSYWFDVYVWFSSNFLVDVWFSSNFFMYIGFGSDFFVDVWFSGYFEVKVWFSSWVYLSGIIVWVDVSSWGSSVSYWGSGIGGSGNWGSGIGGSGSGVSVSSISSIWISISSIGVSWSNNITG